jgi:tight adherence protein B
MAIALAFFVGVLGLVLGSYWLFILKPEETSDRALKRRLHIGGSGDHIAQVTLLQQETPLSSLPFLEKMLRRSSSAVGPLQKLIQHADVKMTVGQFVLLTLLCAAVAFFLVVQFIGDERIALAAAVIFAIIPTGVLKQLAKRRIGKFEEQFPESIDMIARALRAGHSLTTALSLAAEELAEPVRTEFRLLHDRQNYGMPFPEAMRAFAERVPLLDARFFVTAVLTQREAGGNLAEVLDGLSAVIRERFKLKRQVRVLSAHGRITGWILGILPFIIGGALYVVAPEHIAVLFSDPFGLRIVFGALVLQVIGVFFIRRIINIEI